MTFNDLWLPVPVRTARSQQREWLLGYAESLVEARSDLEDYADQSALREELSRLFARLEQSATDPDDAAEGALDALQAYCAAIADAPVDETGERVRPEGLPPLRAARSAFLSALR